MGPGLRILCALSLALLLPVQRAAADSVIGLDVDARQVSRGLLTARLVIPVQPGPLTLLYPKWIPGNHRPSGTATSLSGLAFSAGGQPLVWQRDPVDMFAFHLDVPAGVTEVQASLEVLGIVDAQAPSADRRATAALAAIQWNRVLLYPAGMQSDEVHYAARLHLPAGWQHASALTVDGEQGGAVQYAPVSLTTLIDSPVLAGRHFRTVELGGEPAVRLHIAGDSAAALALKPAAEQHLRRLVAEARELFGAVHYGSYHFLLGLTDQTDSSGLEHHESSDNWVGERALIDDDAFRAMANLLPHEYTHSWNGKYRRPAGLATGNYHDPMQADLLWVYEGLTEYLQEVLAARSGMYTAQDHIEEWAYAAGEMDLRKGREWRPLQDTARGVQLMRGQPQDWLSRRRGVDYYTEGSLLWLEADVLIRTQSKGRRSLDDFCRAFFGGEDSPPRVLTYTFDDVVAALDAVQPHDWRAFWRERLDRTRAGAPLEGIEGAGWRLAFGPEPTGMHKAYDAVGKRIDLRYSLGFALGSDDGLITDIVPGTAADRAGLAPGSVLVAVDGRKWSRELLDDALRASAAGSTDIDLLVQNDDVFSTLRLQYAGGARYPRLERRAGTRDLLAEIARPRAR